MESLGKVIAGIGVFLILLGLTLMLFGKYLGKLPGDIVYKRDGLEIYFPITTSILISLLLSVILNLILWLTGRR